MPKAKLLCTGGTLLFLAAASPAFAQVTILNPPEPPVDVTTSVPAVSPNNAPNSLVVSGPVNKGETVPGINLDMSLSEQSGAPTTNNAEYANPAGGGSREVGGVVGGLLDQIWQKE
jgi:hypothetical protein